MIRKMPNFARLTKLTFILILVLGIFQISGSVQAIAASKKKSGHTSKVKKNNKKKSKNTKRVYHSQLTRQQAIELIRTNSQSISELAGLEPLSNESMRLYSNNYEIVEEGEDIAELETEDDVTVDIESFKMLWLSYSSDDPDDDLTENGIKKSPIMENIMSWLGTPYHFGGTTNKGIDCSAFVRFIYQQSNSILLPRTAREQFTIGQNIKRKGLQFGDLVFFNTRRRVYVSHVGIYLGDNLFAHSSTRFGVTVSSLESTYYNARFLGGKRLSIRDVARLSLNKEL
ncbi:MAG: spr product [Ignavibacteria bacterium]|nr:spr product [Ignavibacteria bacterium]